MLGGQINYIWSTNVFTTHLTMQGRNTVNCNIPQPVCVIRDRACKNRPCESKLHQGIFLLISSIQNLLSHFYKLQKKVHWISSSDEDFVVVVINSYQVMIKPIQTKSAIFCTQMVDCCRPGHTWHTHNAHNVCIASTASPSSVHVMLTCISTDQCYRIT